MRTTSPSDLASRLRLDIARLGRRLRQEAGAGLSPTQTAALATIELHGPLTPSELAQRERVQRPTVTRVLARLEAAGLTERAGDPADRRPLGRAAGVPERLGEARQWGRPFRPPPVRPAPQTPAATSPARSSRSP